MNHTGTLNIGHAAGATSKWAFARHYLEMVVVMFAGMFALGGVTELALGIAGSGLDELSGGLHIGLMGLWMTAPMVAWMAYRGHTRGQNGEMAASMVIPTILAAVLTSVGVLELSTGLAIQHVIMLPAMLGVMLWRYDEYAHVHHG